MLAKEAKKHVYKTSDVIVEQGDASDSMFIIIEGVVKVVVENDKGSSKVVGTLTVGESLGELSLLTGASRSATVSATRPVVLYEIMKDSMAKVMKSNPEVAEGLTQILIKRQKELNHARKGLDVQAKFEKEDNTLFNSVKNSLIKYFSS